jgi:membrane dipeptidase
MKWFRRILVLVVVLLIIAAGVVFFYLPVRTDARLNLVVQHEPYQPSAAAQALQDTLRLADLHADPLLWKRDIVKRNTRGHTDIPRLIEGGFVLQVFSVVSKSPKNTNYVKNADDSDAMTRAAIVSGWPMRTWHSVIERALYLAWKLEDAAQRSGGAMRVVGSKAELQAALDDKVLAGILLSEGGHPLEGDMANLQRMYDAGFRVLGLQHFFDNELGGSLHGVDHSGLTEFGKQAVIEAEKMGMIIDVAHSSEASAYDALALAKKPMIVSHTGLKGHCDTVRNFSDELLKRIAEAGGLIGVGFWDMAICDPTFKGIADAIVYAVDLVGPEHVALGSDFDGGIHTPFDATEMVGLTDELLDAGLDEETIRLVMGENILRLFATYLPDK